MENLFFFIGSLFIILLVICAIGILGLAVWAIGNGIILLFNSDITLTYWQALTLFFTILNFVLIYENLFKKSNN